VGDSFMTRSPRPSTARDQRRETWPLASGLRPGTVESPPAAAFIHAPVGTPKPVFARTAVSFGTGKVGALARAALPAPSVSPGIAGASAASSVKSTSGTRISRLCAIPPSRRRAEADCACSAPTQARNPRDVGAGIGYKARSQTLQWLQPAQTLTCQSPRQQLSGSSCGKNKPRRRR